jgi:hypothetical protein
MLNGAVNLKTKALHAVWDTTGIPVCSTQQDPKDLLPVGRIAIGDSRLCQLCFDYAAEGGDTEFPYGTPPEEKKLPKRPVPPPKDGPPTPK